METCPCGRRFSRTVVIGGMRRHLKGRKLCFECRPFRARSSPRVRSRRPVRIKACESCGRGFAAKQIIGGQIRSLYRRRFCLDCSPFGGRNTSRHPVGSGLDREARRRDRRRRSTVRSLRKRRQAHKARLVRLKGSRCEDCGYDRDTAALEFHHRDRADKEFGIGGSTRGWQRVLAEAAKCVLVCANCHRLRHLAEAGEPKRSDVRRWRDVKALSVEWLGGHCESCGLEAAPGLFEFHHRDAAKKSFGLGRAGLRRKWPEIEAELEKCALLCPNCHRETHTTLRISAARAVAEPVLAA